MRTAHGWLVNLYMVNFALLFTHEMEGAYWREWEMFGISVGISEYLLLHIVLMLAALIGFMLLLRDNKVGYFFSLLLAATGIVAFPIHATYVLTGHEEFQLAISWIILGSALAVSIVQAFLTVKLWRKEEQP